MESLVWPRVHPASLVAAHGMTRLTHLLIDMPWIRIEKTTTRYVWKTTISPARRQGVQGIVMSTMDKAR